MSTVFPLSLVMRTRLLCGLYNRRIVHPRLRFLAQAYCLTIIIILLYYVYFITTIIYNAPLYMFLFSVLGQYVMTAIVSLWTGEEYVYKFFTIHNITDVTLDSPKVFNRLDKQIKQAYIVVSLYFLTYASIRATVESDRGLMTLILITFPSIVIEVLSASTHATKLLIMGLFNSRLLVLRRRLERQGFRTLGRLKPPSYSLIYDEIISELNATDKPLKVMLFFDLIFSCLRIISVFLSCLYGLQFYSHIVVHHVAIMIAVALQILQTLLVCFGHVALLESAASHCEHMAIFTATQLIKTPTSEERRQMHLFLNALAARGARYSVLRAVTLDARLVLQLLGFCSAQIIVLANTIISK